MCLLIFSMTDVKTTSQQFWSDHTAFLSKVIFVFLRRCHKNQATWRRLRSQIHFRRALKVNDLGCAILYLVVQWCLVNQRSGSTCSLVGPVVLVELAVGGFVCDHTNFWLKVVLVIMGVTPLGFRHVANAGSGNYPPSPGKFRSGLVMWFFGPSSDFVGWCEPSDWLVPF